MLDLNNLSSYNLGQIKGELSLLLKKEKQYKLLVIVLSIFCVISLAACISLLVILFNTIMTLKNEFLLPFAIVTFIIFLISFIVGSLYLCVLIPINKNKIGLLKAFLNEK